MDGWIKLNRKLQLNPLWTSEPFTRGQAWVDMIMIANSNDGFFFKRGIRVNVKRGQIGHDIDTLATKWKWSRGKCERFFLMLEMDSQIVRQKSNITTLISISNYETYQSNGKANNKPNDKPNDNANGNKQEYTCTKYIEFKNIYSDFYFNELVKSENLKNDKYEMFVQYLYGKNKVKETLTGILSVEKQLSFEQFGKVMLKCDANKIKLGDILTKIENDPKYYKGKKSIYLTLLNWIDGRFLK